MSRQLYRTALRALVGWQLARVRHRPPEDQLAAVWPKLRSSRVAGFLCARYEHRCELDQQELLMMLCMAAIRRRHPGFALPFRLENVPPELQQTSSPLGAICVSTHSGHAVAATALKRLGHPSCLLVDARPNNRGGQTFLQQMRSRHPDLKLIPNDRLSLARVVRELERGMSVCCAVDYQDLNLKKYCYISPTLFELARRTRRPMYFGRPRIDPDGAAVLTVSGPHFVNDAVESAQDFIRFINDDRCAARHLMVRPQQAELPEHPVHH